MEGQAFYTDTRQQKQNKPHHSTAISLSPMRVVADVLYTLLKMTPLFWIIPPILWFLRQRFNFLRGILPTVILIILSTGILWYSHVHSITSWEAELESQISAYDLNGDGTLSQSERTPEAERLMSTLTADTGRSFGLVAAGPIAVFYTINWFFILWGAKYCWLTIKNKNKN